MRINCLLPVFFVICCISCKQPGKNPSISVTEKKAKAAVTPHTIALLPFSDMDSSLMHRLKVGIENKLAVTVTILKKAGLPAAAYYKPRERYIADSLLQFLNATKGQQFEKIIGVTGKDISTRKGEIANWGILGLGNCPGQSCVISSFRAGQNKVKAPVFYKRMVTLALHELGHTYGLDHCPDNACLMKDAAGKMNLDDGDKYCNKCKLYLNSKGVFIRQD